MDKWFICKCPMKRRALKLLLVLLAGAIINVAVAWGCAMFLLAGPSFLGIHEVKSGGPFILHFVSSGSVSTVVHRRQSVVSLSEELSYPPAQIDLPVWYVPMEPFTTTGAADVQIAWGWPLRGVALAVLEHVEVGSRSRDDVTSIPGILMLPAIDSKWVEEYRNCVPTSWLRLEDDHSVMLANNQAFSRFLPLRPLWPGFAINTIFYAAVLWVLFAVPVKVRRWRRIKRGHCASCGYSLRGTPHVEKCPECGAAA